MCRWRKREQEREREEGREGEREGGRAFTAKFMMRASCLASKEGAVSEEER